MAPSDYSDFDYKVRPRITLRSGFANRRGYGLIGRRVSTTIPVLDGNDVVSAQYENLSYGDIPARPGKSFTNSTVGPEAMNWTIGEAADYFFAFKKNAAVSFTLW
jgi:hypothetical protein